MLTKGPNKFNRLFGTAEKLDYAIVQDIDSGKFRPDSYDKKELKEILSTEYKWDSKMFNEVWSFGPDKCGPNAFV